MNAALFADLNCGLISSSLELSRSLGHSDGKKLSDDLVKCIDEKQAAMTEALTAIPNDPETSALRDSAKSVYSAWLSYRGLLSKGASRDAQNSAPAGFAFNKAMADYRTELMLASP